MGMSMMKERRVPLYKVPTIAAGQVITFMSNTPKQRFIVEASHSIYITVRDTHPYDEGRTRYVGEIRCLSVRDAEDVARALNMLAEMEKWPS